MIIDGKQAAEQIQQELAGAIQQFSGRPPRLDVILVGEHAPSEVYVRNKTRACEKVGIVSHIHKMSAAISQAQLLTTIQQLNQESACDGILVQLPLPSSIDERTVTRAILPEKDVDGFHPVNLGKLLAGDSDGFVPCTPLGIKILCEKQKIAIEGKHVVIVGRSNIVGKPLAALLLQKRSGCNATVTVAHSLSLNLKEICLTADILISAIGKPMSITADMVKEGAVVIDVGTNRVDDRSTDKGYRLVGDVDFEKVRQKCSRISPVPGGVGPMTIAMLLYNTVKSFERRRSS